MLIIWRGWGILVIVIGFVAALLSIFLTDALGWAGLAGDIGRRVAMGLSGAAGGAAIWFVAMGLEGRPSRTLVDPNTGQQVVFRKDAGSLFFIPTKYWAFVLAGLGLLVAVVPSNTFRDPAGDAAAISTPAPVQ